MLRFLYLLSLLLCIELSFCYNYIDEAAERTPSKFGRNVRRERIRRVKRPKERKSLLRQEFDYDRSPVEFDVASFIQPDEETLEEDEAARHRNKKRRRTSKYFDYAMLSNEDRIHKNRDKSPDYMSLTDSASDMNMNPPLFKESANNKHTYNSLEDIHSEKYGHEKFKNIYKDDLLMDQNVVHNHEKKCTIKNIKFPFFSHNKSEPLKPKKNKKRKLFCFNCPKKNEQETKIPVDIKVNDDTLVRYKMKRSYEERLCPVCKKMYFANLEQTERRKKTAKKVIHNSRQFYQNNPDAKLRDDVKNIRKSNVMYSEAFIDSKFRKKREEDRERQLKELEDVQRKVDSVEIRLPTFDRPAEKNSYK